MTALVAPVAGWMVTVPVLSCAGSERRLTVKVAGVVNWFTVALSQLAVGDVFRVKERGVVLSEAVICAVCAAGRVLFGPDVKLKVGVEIARVAPLTTVKVTGTSTS